MAASKLRSALVCALVTIACGKADGTTSSGPSVASSSDDGFGTTATPQGTSSSEGADASGSTGSVSPPDCSDYMGRATPEETAMPLRHGRLKR